MWIVKYCILTYCIIHFTPKKSYFYKKGVCTSRCIKLYFMSHSEMIKQPRVDAGFYSPFTWQERLIKIKVFHNVMWSSFSALAYHTALALKYCLWQAEDNLPQRTQDVNSVCTGCHSATSAIAWSSSHICRKNILHLRNMTLQRFL